MEEGRAEELGLDSDFDPLIGCAGVLAYREDFALLAREPSLLKPVWVGFSATWQPREPSLAPSLSGVHWPLLHRASWQVRQPPAAE